MKAWVFNQEQLEKSVAALSREQRDTILASLGDGRLQWSADQWTFNESALSAMPEAVQAWLRSDEARRLRVGSLEHV